MCAGEVDDDRVGGRLERSRGVVFEAEEEDVGAARRGLVIRDERGQRPVQPGVERRGALARERVGAERQHRQPRMREHPVQGLLAGITGTAEDRNGALHLETRENLAAAAFARTAAYDSAISAYFTSRVGAETFWGRIGRRATGTGPGGCELGARVSGISGGICFNFGSSKR